MYGAFAEHVIYYVVEAESVKALNQFLMPGFKRCERQIAPVSEEPIVQWDGETRARSNQGFNVLFVPSTEGCNIETSGNL